MVILVYPTLWRNKLQPYKQIQQYTENKGLKYVNVKQFFNKGSVEEHFLILSMLIVLYFEIMLTVSLEFPNLMKNKREKSVVDFLNLFYFYILNRKLAEVSFLDK